MSVMCGQCNVNINIVNSCPLTKFDGGLLHLHEADEAAVDWLTTCGSQHTIIIIVVRSQTYGYLPSHKASPSIGWYGMYTRV